ncbi:hypothetical protein K8I31_11510, partial [bacterium]|nr:hypothetical protein [bacterium]
TQSAQYSDNHYKNTHCPQADGNPSACFAFVFQTKITERDIVVQANSICERRGMKRNILTILFSICVCMTAPAQDEPMTVIAPEESRSMGSIATISANGQYIMTASRTVEIWNVNSGDSVSIFKEFDRPFYDSSGMRLIPGGIATTSFSPDETLVVTGGTDFTVMIWDVKTGALLQSLRLDDNVEFGLGNVSTAAISPDNKWLAASATSFDGIIFFDISTGERMRTVNSERAVEKLQFIDNGNKLFYITGQFAKVYDLNTDQAIFENACEKADISYDGSTVYTYGGTIIEGRNLNRDLIFSYSLSGFSQKLWPAFSPGGIRVAVSGENKIQILSYSKLTLDSPEREYQKDAAVELIGHAFAPNGKLYYTYSDDQVFIYDISDLTETSSATNALWMH